MYFAIYTVVLNVSSTYLAYYVRYKLLYTLEEQDKCYPAHILLLTEFSTNAKRYVNTYLHIHVQIT